MENNMLGHNNPPTDEDALRDTLTTRSEDILKRAEELADAADRMPGEIADDPTKNKFVDYLAIATAAAKNLEAARVNEKEPYLKLGRFVDGFFGTRRDRLDAAKAKANKILTAYLRKLEAQEREREREEKRIKDEAAAQALRDAQALEAQGKTAQAEEKITQAVIHEAEANKAGERAEGKASDLVRARGTAGNTAGLRTTWVGKVDDRAQLDIESLRSHIPADALQKALNSFIAAGGRELRGATIQQETKAVVR